MWGNPVCPQNLHHPPYQTCSWVWFFSYFLNWNSISKLRFGGIEDMNNFYLLIFLFIINFWNLFRGNILISLLLVLPHVIGISDNNTQDQTTLHYCYCFMTNFSPFYYYILFILAFLIGIHWLLVQIKRWAK